MASELRDLLLKRIKVLTEENENLKSRLSDVSKTERLLPLDFIIWYSGMKQEQIELAYHRYLNEVKK
jgi:hypothetical protein